MLYNFMINMLGYKMELSLSRHACDRIYERSDYDDPESCLFTLAGLLQSSDVADYILSEVAIGDCAVIADLDRGCTFCLQVCKDSIIVNTVFYPEGMNFRVAKKEFFILIQHAQVLFADLFMRFDNSYFSLI